MALTESDEFVLMKCEAPRFSIRLTERNTLKVHPVFLLSHPPIHSHRIRFRLLTKSSFLRGNSQLSFMWVNFLLIWSNSSWLPRSLSVGCMVQRTSSHVNKLHMCLGFSEQFHIQHTLVDRDGKPKLKHRLWYVILWLILRRRIYLSVKWWRD